MQFKTITLFAFSLLPGILLYTFEQAVNYILDSGQSNYINLAIYLLILFPLSLIGIAALYVLEKKRYFLYTALISIALFMFTILFEYINASFTISGFIASKEEICSLGASLLALGLYMKWSDSGDKLKLSITALVVVAVILFYPFSNPEKMFLQAPYRYLSSALITCVFLGIAYRLFVNIGINYMHMSAIILILLSLNLFISNLYRNDITALKKSNNNSTNVLKESNGDIILIVWDTVRKDHLSAFGYERNTTPFLEGIMKDSMVYSNVISVSPWTLPSHASIFTGLYPRSHGAHHVYDSKGQGHDFRGIPKDFVTIAELLSEKGYQCIGISANPAYAGKSVNIDQGFDYFSDELNPSCIESSRLDLKNYIVGKLKKLVPVRYYHTLFTPYKTAGQVNSLLKRILDAKSFKRPVFLFVNYMDAHGPYYPPPRLMNRYTGFSKNIMKKGSGEIMNEIMNTNRSITVEERRHLVSQYDAEINYLDEELNTLINLLKDRDMYNDFMIILTSDHGELLGERNLIGHELGVCYILKNIHLVVKYPRGLRKGHVDSLYENRYIYNLILGHAGILDDHDYQIKYAVTEFYKRASSKIDDYLPMINTTQRSVFFEDVDYIKYGNLKEELYSISNDESEMNNLINHEESQAELEKARQYMQDYLLNIDEFRSNKDINTKHDLHKLKALGYIK